MLVPTLTSTTGEAPGACSSPLAAQHDDVGGKAKPREFCISGFVHEAANKAGSDTHSDDLGTFCAASLTSCNDVTREESEMWHDCLSDTFEHVTDRAVTDKLDYYIVSDQSIDIPTLDSDIWYDCVTETALAGKNNLMDTRSQTHLKPYSVSPSDQPLDPFKNRHRFFNMTDRNFPDNLTALNS